MEVKLGICNFCTPGVGVFAPRIVAEAGLDGMSVDMGRLAGFPLRSRACRSFFWRAAEIRHRVCEHRVQRVCFIPFHARAGHRIYEIVRSALKNA
jgi:hypothetical protein